MAQWLDRWDELEALARHNPFAVVMMAQLEAIRHPDKATRLNPKVALMRRLYGYGYRPNDVRQLLRLIDWMLRLPEDMLPDYVQAIDALEQEIKMTCMTDLERYFAKRGQAKGEAEGRAAGHAAGRAEGQAELLLRQIGRRFGTVPDEVTERVRGATCDQLEMWSLNFVDATTLDEIFGD